MVKWGICKPGEYLAYFVTDILDLLRFRAEKKKRYRGAVAKVKLRSYQSVGGDTELYGGGRKTG